MRTILAAVVFLCGCLLTFPKGAAAQGCIGIMQPQFSSYTSYAVTESNSGVVSLSVSESVDGYTKIGNTEYCNISSAIHTPKIYVTVNGVGGWQNGPGESPYSYIGFTGVKANSVPIGSQLNVIAQAEVVCSFVGTLFDIGPIALVPVITVTNYKFSSSAPTCEYYGTATCLSCTYTLDCTPGQYMDCAQPYQSVTPIPPQLAACPVRQFLTSV